MWKYNKNLNVKKKFKTQNSFLNFRDGQELCEKKQLY